MTSEERKLRFLDTFVAAYVVPRMSDVFWPDHLASDVANAIRAAKTVWAEYQKQESNRPGDQS